MHTNLTDDRYPLMDAHYMIMMCMCGASTGSTIISFCSVSNEYFLTKFANNNIDMRSGYAETNQ